MSLLNTFTDYIQKDDAARRAVFEAAMVERLKPGGQGYKIADMLYELCDAQARIASLENQVDELRARISKKAKKA